MTVNLSNMQQFHTINLRAEVLDNKIALSLQNSSKNFLYIFSAKSASKNF